MISKLLGNVVKKNVSSVIINAGGVGYEVNLSPDNIEQMKEGENTEVWTQLIFKENTIELYGFPSEEELEFFKLLTSVSGVGPKSALAILSLDKVESLKSAISSGDTTYLTKVSGIGKKSAERMTLELKDKLGAIQEETSKSSFSKEDSEVFEALITLGYNKDQAKTMLKKIVPETEGVNERLKEALKSPNKNQ